MIEVEPEEENVSEEITDSPTDWVAEHVRDYLATNGEKGHHDRGVTSLLITTRGRRSGKLRRTALIYGRDGDRLLVVASNGGSDAHPAWYLNLTAEPEATVQVGADVFTVRARDASAEEKPGLWRTMAGIFPQYDEYQAGTSRDIPVVVLEPVGT